MIATFNRSMAAVAATAMFFSLHGTPAFAQSQTDATPAAAPQESDTTPQSMMSARAAPAPDGKMLAEKFVRPTAEGTVALVFNDKGEVVAVTRGGRVLPSCEICTPELERVYGPKCIKARQMSDVLSGADKTPDDKEHAAGKPPLICNKLMNTNVQSVNPISVVNHTGSRCMTFFFNNGGKIEIAQYCW